MSLERIAKTYKDMYERIEISQEDLEYLQNTIRRVIAIFVGMEQDGAEKAEVQQSVEPLIQLINADTLRTMQLLGFNYKKAIGEPLTEICYDKIKSFSVKNTEY